MIRVAGYFALLRDRVFRDKLKTLQFHIEQPRVLLPVFLVRPYARETVFC
jgi:hypothetical protein